MLGDIQVPELGSVVMEEDVGWLDISVDDVRLMKLVQTFQNIVGGLPDLSFRDLCSAAYGFLDPSLDKNMSTWRSPPSAYSITMHRFSVFSS